MPTVPGMSRTGGGQGRVGREVNREEMEKAGMGWMREKMGWIRHRHMAESVELAHT